jgi:hypothetical protein
MHCAPISTPDMIMNMMSQAAPSQNTGQCDAAVNQMSKLFAGAANAQTQPAHPQHRPGKAHACDAAQKKHQHLHCMHV